MVWLYLIEAVNETTTLSDEEDIIGRSLLKIDS